jgi:hypothetical protein
MMSGWRRDAMRRALVFTPASPETKAAGEHGSAAKKPEGYLLSLDPVPALGNCDLVQFTWRHRDDSYR